MVKKAVILLFILGFLLINPAVTNAVLKSYFEYKTSIEKDTVILHGETAKEQFGSSLAKGDLNKDGFEDIAVGSPYFSTKEKSKIGKVSVFFGREKFDKTALKPDFTIIGESKNNQLGTSAVLGDFNGDGIDDLAIGSVEANRVYMFFGKKDKTFPYLIDLSKNKADITFQTASLNENFGFALDMADVNSDGIADIIIGAPSASQTEKIRSGKIYIVFGYKYPSPQFVYDFNKNPASIIIWGERALDQFGASITHGYINEDKIIDIAAGAYLSGQPYRPEIGKTYVFFGKQPSELGLSKTYPIEIKVPDITINGEGKKNWFGFSLAAGDINNDKIDDIAIGSFMYQSISKTGKTHIFYGRNMGGGRLITDISKTDSLAVLGDKTEEDIIGSSVVLSDLNGDKELDLIIGAPGIGKTSSSIPGYVYVFSNEQIIPLKKLDMAEKLPALVIKGENANDWFGSAVVSADVNNDKYSDLIIGAPNAGNTKAKEGAIYIIFGKSSWIGSQKYKNPSAENFVARGQFAYQLIKEFDLDLKNKDFLDSCKINPDFCFAPFLDKSNFANIKFSPNIILYPDVSSENPFYKEITEISMLGFMNGFIEEKQSPFKPEENITRIHALKTLLTGLDILKWKNYIELKKELGGEKGILNQLTPFIDISLKNQHTWWYPRYVNFAYIANIIKDENAFRPDEPLKQSELEEWIAAIKKFKGEK